MVPYLMDKKISVSIIIPVYKVEKYIERCIQSVIDQAESVPSIECILVDDCGGDRSIDLAEDFIRKYEGPVIFRVIRNELNMGVAASRNTGMQNAGGDYILLLDSDDMLAPDCLKALTAVLTEHPHTDVILGNTYYTHEKRLMVAEDSLPEGFICKKDLLRGYFLSHIPETPWNILVKKDLITHHQLYFVPRLPHEDTLWTFQLFSNTEEFFFVPQVTYIYEDNPASFMNALNPDTHTKGIVYILDYHLDHFVHSLYVDNTLYVLWHLNHEMDVVRNTCLSPELAKAVRKLRNRIFLRDILNLRIILALYELQLFHPFCLIKKWKWYRHHFHGLTEIVRKIANFFSPFHVFTPKK